MRTTPSISGRVPRALACSVYKSREPEGSQSCSSDQQCTINDHRKHVFLRCSITQLSLFNTMASTSRIQQCLAALACILLSLFTSSTSAFPFPDPEPPSEPKPAGGFHFKLAADIQVNASKEAVLKQFTITDLGNNEELFSEPSSGLDNFAGIFRPSNGHYFLSTLVHVAVVVQEEAQNQAENNTSEGEGEKEPRATVSVCIDGNCGSSA